MNFNDDSLMEEEELPEVEGNIANPNRTQTSSSHLSSLEQQLSSSQRELLEKITRNFNNYVSEKEDELERAFAAWIKEVDSENGAEAAELDWEEEQVSIENELLYVDMKLEPLKTRFPNFRKTIGASSLTRPDTYSI